MSPVTWKGDVTQKLGGFDAHTRRAMVAAANYTAPQLATYMKTNAKWTDRTGNARNGLGAKVEVSGNKVAIVLFHSVPYGVFLELRWGGRYAIIKPTMAIGGRMFADNISKLMFNKVG